MWPLIKGPTLLETSPNDPIHNAACVPLASLLTDHLYHVSGNFLSPNILLTVFLYFLEIRLVYAFYSQMCSKIMLNFAGHVLSSLILVTALHTARGPGGNREMADLQYWHHYQVTCHSEISHMEAELTGRPAPIVLSTCGMCEWVLWNFVLLLRNLEVWFMGEIYPLLSNSWNTRPVLKAGDIFLMWVLARIGKTPAPTSPEC